MEQACVKPPQTKSMEEYAGILIQMGEVEGRMLALKQQLRTLPKRMAHELETPQQRLEAARYLYWCTDIPVEAIASGLLGVDADGWNIDTFGTFTSDVNCDRCAQPMVFRSRSQMREVVRDVHRKVQRYAEGYGVLCEACWAEVQEERFVSGIQRRRLT